MGNKPDSSVGETASRTYLPRQYAENLAAPVPILADDDPRHGTWNGYINFRCKCDDCKEAGRAYGAARRAKRKVNAA